MGRVGSDDVRHKPVGSPMETPIKSSGGPLVRRVAEMKDRIRMLLLKVDRLGEVQVQIGMPPKTILLKVLGNTEQDNLSKEGTKLRTTPYKVGESPSSSIVSRRRPETKRKDFLRYAQ